MNIFAEVVLFMTSLGYRPSSGMAGSYLLLNFKLKFGIRNSRMRSGKMEGKDNNIAKNILF